MDDKVRKFYEKKDRTARLLKIQLLLSQNPGGLDVRELANECSVSFRTIYRDIRTLELDLDVPIWMNNGKYAIAEGHYLPPVSFTIEEAVNIFMAVRLMQNLSYQYNPSISSTFMKLNTIVPPTLKPKIQNTLEYMKKQPLNERKLSVFNKLIQGWLTQHAIKINYLKKYGQRSEEFIIEPYFIEPSILGHSSYVIAYCQQKHKVLTFKADAIIGDVEVRPETFKIPSDFNVIEHLGSQWDVDINQKLKTVRLHFNSKISKRIMETIWHPSQLLEKSDDGSLIMTLKVRDLNYFRAWVLGWGEDVEVIKPLTFRKHVKNIVNSLADIYNCNKSI